MLKIDNITIAYKDVPTVVDFSLDMAGGQIVSLVGESGSGKTTVVNLLMRFYDIDNGSITIDGVNIKDIDCENLRKNTAIVLQDTVLFADTVKNNLLYSRQDAPSVKSLLLQRSLTAII